MLLYCKIYLHSVFYTRKFSWKSSINDGNACKTKLIASDILLLREIKVTNAWWLTCCKQEIKSPPPQKKYSWHKKNNNKKPKKKLLPTLVLIFWTGMVSIPCILTHYLTRSPKRTSFTTCLSPFLIILWWRARWVGTRWRSWGGWRSTDTPECVMMSIIWHTGVVPLQRWR